MLIPSIDLPEAPAASGPAAPLGAAWDGAGVDFRLLSKHAEAVELCLFDEGRERRAPLARSAGNLWHTRVDGLGPGALYGYRVHGRFAPQDGLLFNPSKLLIDPYARAVTGEPTPDPSLFGFVLGENPAHSYDSRDSAAAMPRCVVVDDTFDWQGVERPRVPWSETVLYETHVRGMTRLHPDVPEELRGTYAGLVQEPVLDHLRRLGVTSIQLLPVFQSAPEAHLLARGRRNYWGYSPVSFFAPNAHYAAAGSQVAEWKTMVRELHRAGFEVILDVVYNHTAEGGLRGPIYGMKGIDNPSYYRLRRDLPSRWIDVTGCGNTLDVSSPTVHRLVLDSLRYWVGEMGVDGFRFDLATVLGRETGDFRADSALFRAIDEDPLLADAKWIAEPWDLGPHGYRLGHFPARWSEWNDRFRDATRRVWRGEASGPTLSDLASRITGSRDVFDPKGRGPTASLNYVISHDGFTLADWVSYERKHNEANGEHNRDGTDNNLSRNWGHEGPSDDPVIRARRDRVRRGVLATLFFSQGVPMLHHGDEIGRSQQGNNNPYCQDNELAWTDWSRPDRELESTVAELIRLRKRYPHLRREEFLDPYRGRPGEGPTALWLGLDGRRLRVDDWHDDELRTLVLVLPPTVDDPPETLLMVIHGGFGDVDLRLGKPWNRGPWTVLFDSALDPGEPVAEPGPASRKVEALSVLLMSAPWRDEGAP